MAELNFDPSTVQAEAADKVPTGEYLLEIQNTEVKPNSSGTGQVLKVDLQVAEGPQKGSWVNQYINYQHETPKIMRLGQVELAQLCRACGIEKLKFTEELHEKQIIARVIAKPDKKDDDKIWYELKSIKAPQQRTTAPTTPPKSDPASDTPSWVQR